MDPVETRLIDEEYSIFFPALIVLFCLFICLLHRFIILQNKIN